MFKNNIAAKRPQTREMSKMYILVIDYGLLVIGVRIYGKSFANDLIKNSRLGKCQDGCFFMKQVENTIKPTEKF